MRHCEEYRSFQKAPNFCEVKFSKTAYFRQNAGLPVFSVKSSQTSFNPYISLHLPKTTDLPDQSVKQKCFGKSIYTQSLNSCSLCVHLLITTIKALSKMTVYNDQMNIDLNTTIRSLPLAVNWLTVCNVQTHKGAYVASDVCQCLQTTAGDLNRIRRYEEQYFEPNDLNNIPVISEESKTRFERILTTECNSEEIDRVINYSRLLVDIQDPGIQTSSLQSLLNEYDSYREYPEASVSLLQRLFLALSCLIVIICVTMECKSGSNWMDDCLVTKGQNNFFNGLN